MNNLSKYGWNHYSGSKQTFLNTIGKVISIKGFKYGVISDEDEIECELSGKLLYGVEPESLPKVGDWVEFVDYNDSGLIIHVLPRENELFRKSPGTKAGKQVLGVNIDKALLVQGLDRDFNIMRLDRYLVQVISCGIRPVVVLNKVDLVEDLNYFRNEILRLKRDCPVYFCSTYTGAGIDLIHNEVLEKEKTHILLGSSGVGKSSLLNLLLGGAIQKTDALSGSTNKGKHTTTTRELFLLPNGSLIMDTPGMREFGVTLEDAEGHSDQLFPGIAEFAINCRYADCKHTEEAGCAVLEAMESGLLDPVVYQSYIKLLKEQKRFEISAEDKKRMGKQFGKMSREALAYRKKYKY